MIITIHLVCLCPCVCVCVCVCDLLIRDANYLGNNVLSVMSEVAGNADSMPRARVFGACDLQMRGKSPLPLPKKTAARLMTTHSRVWPLDKRVRLIAVYRCLSGGVAPNRALPA